MKVGVNGTPGGFVLNKDTGKALTLRGAVPADVVNNAVKMMQN